jgi:hypothetical protein
LVNYFKGAVHLFHFPNLSFQKIFGKGVLILFWEYQNLDHLSRRYVEVLVHSHELMKVKRRVKAFGCRIFLQGYGMHKRISVKRIGTDNRVSHTESVRRVTTKNAADLVLCPKSTVAKGTIEVKPGGTRVSIVVTLFHWRQTTVLNN